MKFTLKELKSNNLCQLFNNCPNSDIVNWKFSATWSPTRRCVDIDVLFLSSRKVYLVDSGVTFSGADRDGVEIKKFTVGEIPVIPGHVEWVNVFTVSDVKCTLCTTPTKVHFKVRLCYRLEKSFSCICHACDDCLALTLHTPTQPPMPPQPLQSLVADFQKICLSTVSSDILFVFGQESIPAHQLILSARVPFFERLFASGRLKLTSLYFLGGRAYIFRGIL